MSFEIQIEEGTKEAARKLLEYPGALANAIFRGFQEEAAETHRTISYKRLTGKGPFPVSMHRLGHRTRELIKSFSYEGPHRKGDEISVEFGASVFYAKFHEFGLHKQVTRKAHTVDSYRRKLRKPKGRRKTYKVEAHKRKQSKPFMLDIPARAPVKFGIQDRLGFYEKAITRAIIDTWSRLKTK